MMSTAGKKKKRDRNKTTYESMMSDPKRAAKYAEEYNQFLLSEYLRETMEEQHISIRSLATKSRVAKSMIQDLRDGKKKNPGIDVFTRLLRPLGAHLVIRDGKREVTVG